MALDDTTVLDRLNNAERDVLALLARGHTAKSVASLRGCSVAAVNERLRAARRKTGVGSSRELARLFSAQKNRDDLIDLVSDTPAPPSLLRPDAPPVRRAPPLRRWRPLMIATGLAAVALLAQQTATPPETPSRGEADFNLAAEILARQPPRFDVDALHAETASGPRDPTWSEQSERALRQRYRQVPGFDGAVQPLSISCSATLCEVAGATRPDLSTDTVTNLMTRLQTLGHPEPVPGLQQMGHQFSTTDDRPPAFVFVSYWRRN